MKKKKKSRKVVITLYQDNENQWRAERFKDTYKGHCKAEERNIELALEFGAVYLYKADYVGRLDTCVGDDPDYQLAWHPAKPAEEEKPPAGHTLK